MQIDGRMTRQHAELVGIARQSGGGGGVCGVCGVCRGGRRSVSGGQLARERHRSLN